MHRLKRLVVGSLIALSLVGGLPFSVGTASAQLRSPVTAPRSPLQAE
jgi:hypothetical protein